jgi:hypothetical protein
MKSMGTLLLAQTGPGSDRLIRELINEHGQRVADFRLPAFMNRIMNTIGETVCL